MASSGAKHAARSAVNQASRYKKYTVQPQGWGARISSWFSIDPSRSSGVPLNPQFRNPPPGGNDPRDYDDPVTVPAADLAENPYWKRDVRRQYPKLSVVNQSDVVGLLTVGSKASPRDEVLKIGDAGQKQLVAVKEEGERGLAKFFEKEDGKKSAAHVLGPGGMPPLPSGLSPIQGGKRYEILKEQTYGVKWASGVIFVIPQPAFLMTSNESRRAVSKARDGVHSSRRRVAFANSDYFKVVQGWLLHQMARSGTDTLGISALEVILSCSICQATINEIYNSGVSSRGLHDGGKSDDNSVIKLWITDCVHLTCGVHLQGGGKRALRLLTAFLNTEFTGAPFHPDGESPRAPCPFCILITGDQTPRNLYGIRAISEGGYDSAIPPAFFNIPPVRLDLDAQGMTALKFQYLSLIRFGRNTLHKLRQQYKISNDLKMQVNQESSKAKDLEQCLQELGASYHELERNEKELQSWRRKLPELKHYLTTFQKLANENEVLRKQLVRLGCPIPTTRFSYRAQHQAREVKPGHGPQIAARELCAAANDRSNLDISRVCDHHKYHAGAGDLDLSPTHPHLVPHSGRPHVVGNVASGAASGSSTAKRSYGDHLKEDLISDFEIQSNTRGESRKPVLRSTAPRMRRLQEYNSADFDRESVQLSPILGLSTIYQTNRGQGLKGATLGSHSPPGHVSYINNNPRASIRGNSKPGKFPPSAFGGSPQSQEKLRGTIPSDQTFALRNPTQTPSSDNIRDATRFANGSSYKSKHGSKHGLSNKMQGRVPSSPTRIDALTGMADVVRNICSGSAQRKELNQGMGVGSGEDTPYQQRQLRANSHAFARVHDFGVGEPMKVSAARKSHQVFPRSRKLPIQTQKPASITPNLQQQQQLYEKSLCRSTSSRFFRSSQENCRWRLPPIPYRKQHGGSSTYQMALHRDHEAIAKNDVSTREPAITRTADGLFQRPNILQSISSSDLVTPSAASKANAQPSTFEQAAPLPPITPSVTNTSGPRSLYSLQTRDALGTKAARSDALQRQTAGMFTSSRQLPYGQDWGTHYHSA
ncbi:MAG: hypothetical protein M1821_005922 [Bathelium mastoideum]|nr:MAG: hypothetical protein M1821_005922 [Bathelium mastoideum]